MTNFLKNLRENKIIDVNNSTYKKLGIKDIGNSLKNLNNTISLKEEAPKLSMNELREVSPETYDLLLKSTSKPIINNLLKKYEGIINKLASGEIEGEEIPFKASYNDLGKKYAKQLSNINNLLNETLVEKELLPQHEYNFEKNLKDEVDLQFEPKANYLTNAYLDSLDIDISKMSDKQMKSLYRMNKDLDPSFEYIIPLDENLKDVHDKISKEYENSKLELKRLKKLLEKKENQNDYELTKKYLSAKKIHVTRTQVLKSNIIVMRGLEVVASAIVVEGSYNLNYELNVNDEVEASKEGIKADKAPEIDMELDI